MTDKELIEQTLARDAAGKQAAANPLPGPLADVFKPNPDIEVPNASGTGAWRVRRFVDRDFEWLKALDHPLNKLKLMGQRAAVTVAMKFKPSSSEYSAEVDKELARLQAEGELDAGLAVSGPSAWEAAWIMTRPTKVCKELFRLGPERVREAAADEFGECNLAELKGLADAVNRQMEIYWSPVVGYGPSEQKPAEDGEVQQVERPFPSTGGPTTGSGG